MTDFETIKVETHTVSCDGGKGALGHPKIYMEFAPNQSEIVCPYCSRKFLLKTQNNKH